MIVNNKIKGVAPMAQRSGRPLQCIMGTLNSKNGRIRGNLMGKRVDLVLVLSLLVIQTYQ
jgi:DNA-directed RNA polymerase II subunit RPB1